MTHQAQRYLTQTIFSGNSSVATVEQHSLNQSQASGLSRCLKNDAISYLYSSIVSLGDATFGINRNLLTWATVKLYYATFYALRSLLAMNDICIFYVKSSPTKTIPFTVNAQVSSTPKKAKIPGTHKLVIDTFIKTNIEPLLVSQQIELQEPLEWLMEKREQANYKNAKFYEPQVPKHFEKIINFGLRRVIHEYLSDPLNLYLFDPDHAILAYPLKTIQITYNKILATGNMAFVKDEIKYLCQLFSDDKGLIPDMYNLLMNKK
ncbi:hypothetical protein [Anabaena catenula]|uniref:Uncharacterized protein n=1 Tax=Anabaena catenula FACHB-362 TaxID=2692877 RepID=A0ABR8IY55_9NOST|nr:hypothetical protein [Anabaena catenula]MBD2690509.1 hypothetical protein [Anabaena catenula FACHB-362]